MPGKKNSEYVQIDEPDNKLTLLAPWSALMWVQRWRTCWAYGRSVYGPVV